MRSERRLLVGLLVFMFIVGVVMLTSSVVFLQNFGKTACFSGATPVDTLDSYDEVPENETISYEQLPPTAQDSVDAAIAHEDHRMYHPQDTEAINALSANRFVEHDGTVYLVELSHGDGFIVFVWVRWALAATGSVLILLGGGGLLLRRIQN